MTEGMNADPVFVQTCQSLLGDAANDVLGDAARTGTNTGTRVSARPSQVEPEYLRLQAGCGVSAPSRTTMHADTDTDEGADADYYLMNQCFPNGDGASGAIVIRDGGTHSTFNVSSFVEPDVRSNTTADSMCQQGSVPSVTTRKKTGVCENWFQPIQNESDSSFPVEFQRASARPGSGSSSSNAVVKVGVFLAAKGSEGEGAGADFGPQAASTTPADTSGELSEPAPAVYIRTRRLGCHRRQLVFGNNVTSNRPTFLPPNTV